MLLIYLVNMCLKCLHPWLGSELHFLQFFSIIINIFLITHDA